MADALVSIVLKKLRDALVSTVREEVYLIGGAHAELENISSAFESIQALLNDAEIIQFHNKSMQVWLQKLKDVAYDLEDLLEEMIPWPEPESGTDDGDDQRMENQAWRWLFSLFSCCGLEDWIRLAHESWTDGDDTDNGSIGEKVRTFFPTIFNKVMSLRNFAHQIKEVRAKLDRIAADKSNFIFTEIHSFRGGSHPDKDEFQTSSLVHESKMLGRDTDKDIIISKLVSGSSSEEGGIHVISIVGVGGLGKTTLARLIYNDSRVTRHFRKQVIWVCVSDDFNIINLTKAIIKAAGGTSTLHSPLDSLQKHLLETLQGKRFLLVLDDVWNDNSEKWEQLWLSFQSGAPGSKILVTTRSEKVAITCESAYMHKLKGLSDDHCWLLFSSRAFARRKGEDCLALEKIGREIVKKCKGVPLSAKVMGSAMRSKTSTQDWQNILESQTWEIPDIANGILPALLLSYYNLPVHLKQCFAYCSVFPKDYVMKKDRLVQLWLAQGFIKPEGKREMEAIGGEYFDDLLAHSLFQKEVLEEKEEEKVSCTIHDLLHDLAQFITKNEYCIFENEKSNSSPVTARHSSFIVNFNTSQIPAPLCNAKKLRTLLQIGDSSIDTIPDDLFQCSRSLRALDLGGSGTVTYRFRLGGTRIKELPSSIGLLKHLRYLDLSDSKIDQLPESVTHLRNLQTLKLNYCRELASLPRGMGKLVSLRHLEIAGTMELKCLPEGLGRISSLQTLSRFMVGGDGGCKIGELEGLNSLQGKLVIENLERVGTGDEGKKAKLYNKLHLRELFLQMLGEDDFEMSKYVEGLPDDVLEMWDSDQDSSDDDLEMPKSEEVLPDDDLEMSGGDDLEMSGDDDLQMSEGDGPEMSGDDEVKRMDDVLEALRPPHANLENLVIERYIGSKFPTWMEDLPFSNLVDLRLIDCYKCTQLPGLGRLPSLKCLQIKGGLIKRVGHEFYGNSCGGGINGVTFPKLEKLKFSFMNELEEWELRLEDGEIMPSLHTLQVYYCPKMRSLPDDLGQLKSLRNLRICKCLGLRSLPQGLQGVTRLHILGSPMLAGRCIMEDWSNISHIPHKKIDYGRIKIRPSIR